MPSVCFRSSPYIRHIYRKLEVGLRAEALYESVSLGLIDLDSPR